MAQSNTILSSTVKPVYKDNLLDNANLVIEHTTSQPIVIIFEVK